MKQYIILIFLFLLCIIRPTTAQVIDPKEEAEKLGTKRVNNQIEEGIDKGFNKIEEGIGSLFGKKKKSKKNTKETESSEKTQQASVNDQSSADSQDASVAHVETSQATVLWSRFDFVPGDEVILEDGPDLMEENGEFPSRWDLHEGNCEIINVDGENVIAFPKGGTIIPYLENRDKDYLPDVFTIELDAWFYTDTNQRNLHFYFFDKKNQKQDGLYHSLNVNSYSVKYKNSDQSIAKENPNGVWRHVSIAYTKGKLKVYLDETRLLNIPHMDGNPKGVSIEFKGYASDQPNELQYIKNIRIAKGGVKYYERIMTDGKIICNGIRFDTGKATLKPESLGPINKIYELMQKQPDLHFSVEGHTDADGDDAKNKILSEQRAKTVVAQLVDMGIDEGRLCSKGFGESMPIAENSSPEGKANNRRVEFVKK